MIANTPMPPYYAVIFTSEKIGSDSDYSEMSDLMQEMVTDHEGFLGMESARNEIGITVSYWKDLESIKKWKMNTEHLGAQEKGKAVWYKNYKTRICLVERDYKFEK